MSENVDQMIRMLHERIKKYLNRVPTIKNQQEITKIIARLVGLEPALTVLVDCPDEFPVECYFTRYTQHNHTLELRFEVVNG